MNIRVGINVSKASNLQRRLFGLVVFRIAAKQQNIHIMSSLLKHGFRWSVRRIQSLGPLRHKASKIRRTAACCV